jgi:hypothetical protein
MSDTGPFRSAVAFCGGPYCALSASPCQKTKQPGSASKLMNAESKPPRRLALSTRNRGSGLPRNGLSWRCQLRNAGSNGLFRAHQQTGLTTVKDYQASIEKLRRDAAEAALRQPCISAHSSAVSRCSRWPSKRPSQQHCSARRHSG